MNIALTEEQRKALESEAYPRLRDAQTNEVCVLIKEDVFKRMRRIVDGFARTAGWDDPALDAYEQHRERT